MYTLYSYYRSSCSWRVRLALELKSLPYTLIQVNLLEDAQNSLDYLRINPSGVVPALITPSNEIIVQSIAILEYLEEEDEEMIDEAQLELKEVPSSSLTKLKLLPETSLKRAQVRQLVQIIASDCQPLQNLHVLRRFKALNPSVVDDEAARSLWGRHFIQKALRSYTKLVDSLGGKFSVGDKVSMADLCLIPQLYNARRFAIDLEIEFPRLVAIESNFRQIYPEAFKRAHPDFM